MTRWKVKKLASPHALWQRWIVYSPTGIHPSGTFSTWREAMDYADRKARTREIVLPRPQLNEDGNIEFDFTEWAGLDYSEHSPHVATYERGLHELDVFIPWEHWEPLATALFVLVEKTRKTADGSS